MSDTSPVRALSFLRLLELLEKLFGTVLIPPAVVAELEFPTSRHPALYVRDLPYIQVHGPSRQVEVERLAGLLGSGEAEAIALALELNSEAILIDEAAGREVARKEGLRPIGALGVLIRAKQRGLIPAVNR